MKMNFRMKKDTPNVFRKEISQVQIVTYLINTDKQFYETYQFTKVF